MNIFTLMGTILVDNVQANESISKTGKEAEGLMGKVGKGIGSVAKVGLVVGTAAIAAGTALTGMAMKSAEATDRIDKMSAKIGISKTAFQEWDYVLGQNGMDVEKMQVGMKTLTSAMDGASNGSKGAIENFEKLGLTWNDGAGKLKSQEDMMNETIMALANMENGTEKARMATEMFGKAGIEMMPMLNNGAAGITDLKNRASELGLVMSDEAVNAGVLLGDTMDDVKDSFGAIATKIGVEVMPIIQSLLEVILNNMPAIQVVLGAVFDFLSIVVGTAVDLIGGLIDWIQQLTDKNTESGKYIAEIWEVVKEIFKKTFENISELIETFVEFAQAFWKEWGDDITAGTSVIFDLIKTIFSTAFKAINDILDIFIALFKGDWEGLWNAVKKLVSDIWSGITKAMKIWVDGLVDLVVGIATNMYNAGKKAMNNFFDGLKAPWKAIENWINSKIGWIDEKFGQADTMGSKLQDSQGGKKSTKVNGSHANGLEYVPFDGYIAELHKGEQVLTANEVNQQRNSQNQSDNFYFTINTDNIKELNDLVEIAKNARRMTRMGVI